MQIDNTLILRIEKLAKLQLSTEERQTIQKDLNNILNMFEKLNEIDTQGVAPLTYISEEVNVLREDIVKNQVSQAQAVANAPNTDGTYFKVPKFV
jgi:aspartyl-tRNA(Asn)/glutamyl-tRNA(Gln) amidotransferase subunit C